MAGLSGWFFLYQLTKDAKNLTELLCYATDSSMSKAMCVTGRAL